MGNIKDELDFGSKINKLAEIRNQIKLLKKEEEKYKAEVETELTLRETDMWESDNYAVKYVSVSKKNFNKENALNWIMDKDPNIELDQFYTESTYYQLKISQLNKEMNDS
jgi:hypothetical protein